MFMKLAYYKQRISHYFTKYLLQRKRGVEVFLGSNVRFVGRPIIVMVKGTKLSMGQNVLVNSDRINYHLNMYTPCKFLLDREGGEIIIGENTRIHGTCIHAYKRVTIGKNCLIAANTQIMDGNGHDLSFPDVSQRINTIGRIKPVTIMDNVWIGTNVVILPGVTIGEGSVISANSVVHKNIPSMVVAGGNPIKIIKQY